MEFVTLLLLSSTVPECDLRILSLLIELSLSDILFVRWINDIFIYIYKGLSNCKKVFVILFNSYKEYTFCNYIKVKVEFCKSLFYNK